MRTKIKLSLKLLENELSKIHNDQKINILGGTGGNGLSGINDTTGIFTQLQGRLNYIENNSSANMANAPVGSQEYDMQSKTFNMSSNLNNMLSTLANMYSVNVFMASPGQPTGVTPTSTNSFDIYLNPADTDEGNQGLLMHEFTHINDVSIGNMMVLETTEASSLITTAPSGPPSYGFKGADMYDEERGHLNQHFVMTADQHFKDQAKTDTWMNEQLSDPRYDNLEWADKNVWNNYESTENITSTGGAGSSTTEGSYITTFYGN
ncbi:hypothetical protein [Sphingobacterium anhuiense]|uniref:hypothetical protein n=1 Tax=Sphingobacterium anhuiense TaxID=493780 RepID=UPI003C308770